LNTIDDLSNNLLEPNKKFLIKFKIILDLTQLQLPPFLLKVKMCETKVHILSLFLFYLFTFCENWKKQKGRKGKASLTNQE